MKQKKILIVDQDEKFLNLSHQFLSDNSEFSIELAQTGQQALSNISNQQPDLVLLNSKLPQMSAFEVCNSIRQLAFGCELPILIMTEDNDFEALDKAYQAGATDFMNRPRDWPCNTLLYKIRYLLRAAEKFHHQNLKQADELANRQNSKLLRELQFQKHALDAHAIVSITDVKGNITYVNEKFCAISGYQREELLGKNHRMLKSGEHSAEMYRELWSSITHGRTWHGEIRNFKKNGQDYWVRASIVPFMNENKKPFQYVSIRTDITKFKELENKLQITVHQAEAANQAKSEFLAMMSHEIRTPMHGILGMTELLVDTPLSREQKEYSNSIYQSGQALLTIINDILDFSKIEAGKFNLEHQPFNLLTCAQESLNLIRPITEEKSLKIDFYSCPEPKYFIGDANRIRQILINLLGNAAKFTPGGSISLNLSCDVISKTQAKIKVLVADTGIGISLAAQKNLFSLFTQADSTTTRKFGGTGLGLAISKKLVELMHGQISVTSVEGKGSEFCFIIQLPLATASDIEQMQALLRQNTSDNLVQFKGHILLVEDVYTNQKIAKANFKKLGLSVVVANNGYEAIEKWQKQSFDLIFMDCLMPEMDGYEATKRIRALEVKGQRIPILALTANAFDIDRDKCLAIGMDDVLAKPFSRSQLINALSHWLESKAKILSSDSLLSPEQAKTLLSPKVETELESLDTETLLELKEILEEDFSELKECFLSESNEMLAHLEDHYNNNNLTEIKHIAHSIKSSSANIGAIKLSALAASMELQADEGELIQAKKQISTIIAEFARVRTLLEDNSE